MALIRAGVIVAAISGAIGGQVFVNAKNGLIVRPRTYRRTPSTQKALRQQALFANATRRWQTLTPQLREAWRAIALQLPATNRIGLASARTGFALFVRAQLNSQRFFSLPQDDPIPTSLPSRLTNFAINFTDAPLYALTFDNQGAQTGWLVQVFGSRSFSTAQPKFPKHFREIQITVTPPIFNSGLTLQFDWEATLGLMTTGETFAIDIIPWRLASSWLPLTPLRLTGTVLAD